MDLIDLLKRSEGKTLEFKRDLSSPDGVLRTIIAFSNTAGGTLLIGVEDKTRHVRGVQKPLAMEERLANLISDSVIPHLLPDLETLRLVDKYQRRKVLTIGGMLLFGKERECCFPDAWIQAGRFRGTDKTHIADSVEIRSYPVQAVEEAIAFVQKHALHGVEIGAVRRKERWNLPPAAVREAIINAVVHADYGRHGAPIRISIFDDRLEVENPGLLPFGLTVEDLRHGISKLRNRVIGRVFHELGLIEQWGSGIQRMTAACCEAGLAAPELEESSTRFRVTIFTARTGAPSIDKTDQAILDALAGDKGLSTREIAAIIKLSARATRTRLSKLVERGLVSEVRTSPQDPKRRYFRAG